MKSFRAFKFPYVYLEDTKGKCQPVYKEYAKKQPALNLNSAFLGCPFLPEKKPRAENKTTLKSKRPRSKVRYCEICCSKYDDYESHVSTALHRSFGDDNSNYKAIDAFVTEIRGTTFSQRHPRPSPCERLDNLYATAYLASSAHSVFKLCKFETFETEGITEEDVLN
ncbi:hypothetical protein ECANGB1_320 [Enterospora canceri]|uniref:DBF4-type domain-containing protein n=1 Tax=Enterospora canceri TaxID=1081671 RepID=A0A1Y1S8Y4_9MICR|nr:hypothetical protein ECANGB1_320 [Enterospora canceri]